MSHPTAVDAKPRNSASVLRWLRTPETGLVLGIVAVLGLIYILEPSHGFFASENQRTLFHNVALYGVMALGAAVVIIAGGIDLSVGAVAALSSVLCAKLMTEWLPGAIGGGAAIIKGKDGIPIDALPMTTLAIAIALTLLMGLMIGLLHAFLINRVGLPPFIATLATMAGLRSLAQIISTDQTISLSAPRFVALGENPWVTVPIFAVLAVLVAVIMRMTVLGRHLYALGGNEAAARLSGLPTRRLKAFAYGLSGMLSALGGILFSAKIGLGDSQLGVGYELYAITAAVVGGCSLAGGVGTIPGTVLGLFLIRIIIMGTGLVVRDVDTHLLGIHIALKINSTQVEGIVLGTVIVLAVALNQKVRGRG
jgi:ribose/xylose/arabinose/galactoside ABC-type transport system permease subunit